MEKSEPTFIPQWLRSSGSVSGGGSSAHPFASSTASHSGDVSSLAHHSKNRNSKNTSDFDSPRSAFLDRSSSSNSRRSSSNGSARHAYSSFSRSHRDKDRERDKDRLNFGDHWDRDSSDPLTGILNNRVEKDTLRRSHSVVSRKQGEMLPRKAAANGSGNNYLNGNGVISGGSIGGGSQKVIFDKDFPSLCSEDRQGVPDIGRVSSPGLSMPTQTLPVSTSALVGAEGWNSALADAPPVISSSATGSLSTVQAVSSTASGASSATAGLNMAEALTQAPSRAQTVPQLSIQTQKLEELALKQSRQLVPMVSSKVALNSSDKSKPKTAVRSGEVNVAPKSLQPQPSSPHPANQSVLGGLVKPDTSKASHGNFVILKQGLANGALPSPKDAVSPTNSVAKAANSQLAAAPSVPSAPLRTLNSPKLSAGDRKSAGLNLFSIEKRPSLSQAQSRNDFFNLLKKKNSMNASVAGEDLGSVVSSPTSEKSCEADKEAISGPTGSQSVKNGSELTSNGSGCEEFQRLSEEEANFLRSLGWEENAGEDGGLTEEEINSFYQKYLKSKPSLKVCRGVQQRLLLLESNAADSAGGSLGPSSSDSGSEA